jgi:hypothetical protein
LWVGIRQEKKLQTVRLVKEIKDIWESSIPMMGLATCGFPEYLTLIKGFGAAVDDLFFLE